MAEQEPQLVILAGPNGAGKSTLAPELLARFGVGEFVNADTIARGLSAFDPDSAAFEAGRVMLGRLKVLASQRRSFAFETTLASRTFASLIRFTGATNEAFETSCNSTGRWPRVGASSTTRMTKALGF